VVDCGELLGKVRIGKVKSVSNELVDKYGDVFTTDFETNKKLVYQYTDIQSKHLDNRVAGYVTRLLINQKKRAEAVAAEEAELASQEGAEKAATTEATTPDVAQEASQEAATPQSESKSTSDVETPPDEEEESGETKLEDASKKS
jgi:small subunit ribosomal protein S17e